MLDNALSAGKRTVVMILSSEYDVLAGCTFVTAFDFSSAFLGPCSRIVVDNGNSLRNL